MLYIPLLLEASPTVLGLMAALSTVIIYLFWQKLGKKSGEMDLQREVIRALSAGRYVLALQRARELEQHFPDNFRVHELKLTAMIAEGNLQAAIKEGEQVLQRKPDQKPLHRLLHWAHLLRADYAQAEHHLEKALKGQPGQVMKLHRGVLQAFRGDAAAARQTLQPLLRQQMAAPMSPRNPFAPKKKGNAAPPQPQQVTVVPPQVGPDDLPELGLAYYLVGEQDAAMRLWEQIFKSNDRGLLASRALLYRANVHLHAHNYQAALDDLGLVQNIMPNNPQLHYLLYAVHRILNNKDNADYHLQKAISMGHTSAAAGRDGDVPQLFPAPSHETPEAPHAQPA